MVETERSQSQSHRSGSSARRRSVFFPCFTSRSSSSSMKLSSKSIRSPGRTRGGGGEPSLSLSSSLSRRLRSNGSMKGGQASPMFPTGSKKKGGSFEPPEPSSPKVTCIGQVRVKSKKKHGRKLRNRSQRRGEVSFRKTEQIQDGFHLQQPPPQECLPHRSQRWVHLPLSICETLRAFGAEFNCFVPCGRRSSSSCSWVSEREEIGKRRERNSVTSSTSCGAVFARWLFALQENEEKGREIEPVVTEQENREIRDVREVREVKEVVPKMEREEKSEIEIDEEEELEEGRESICIPPKNALLLMRSRSAPFRMSSLANRFWDSPGAQDNEEEETEEEGEEVEIYNAINEEIQEAKAEEEGREELELKETKVKEMVEEEIVENFQEPEEQLFEEMSETQSGEEHKEVEKSEIRQEQPQKAQLENLGNGYSSLDGFEVVKERVDGESREKVEKKEERRVSFSSSTMYLEPEVESESEIDEEADLEDSIEKSTVEEEVSLSEEEKEISSRSQQINGQEEEENQDQEDLEVEEKSKGRETETETEKEESSMLPECLLLMMCEPKLSMEVSKETWVCSTDFIRCRPSEKKNPKKNNGDESTKKRLSTDKPPTRPVLPRPQQKNQKQFQVEPPRSSCSKVEKMVAESLATVIDQKLTNGGAYEPIVLKRCKSEPMRNSAKLAPDVCFWKKNKMESHQPPSLGVGATGC